MLILLFFKQLFGCLEKHAISSRKWCHCSFWWVKSLKSLWWDYFDVQFVIFVYVIKKILLLFFLFCWKYFGISDLKVYFNKFFLWNGLSQTLVLPHKICQLSKMLEQRQLVIMKKSNIWWASLCEVLGTSWIWIFFLIFFPSSLYFHYFSILSF